VQAVEQTESRFPNKITFTHNISSTDTGRRKQTQGNINIDRQRQTEQKQTKYKHISNITRWRQVTQMNRTMNRWLI